MKILNIHGWGVGLAEARRIQEALSRTLVLEGGPERGTRFALKIGDERVGCVLRTRGDVRPIFVSPGHRICSERAAAVALASCGQYRLPEPIRRARILANRMRKGMS